MRLCFPEGELRFLEGEDGIGQEWDRSAGIRQGRWQRKSVN